SVGSGELNEQFVARAKASGDLREDVRMEDLPLVLEMVAAIRPGVFGDEERTSELRQRYLSLCLDGLRSGAPPLTGAPPTEAELGRRCVRRGGPGSPARERDDRHDSCWDQPSRRKPRWESGGGCLVASASIQ